MHFYISENPTVLRVATVHRARLFKNHFIISTFNKFVQYLKIMGHLKQQSVFVLVTTIIIFSITHVITVELSYTAIRDKIMENERLASFGGNLWLSSAEEKANGILMNAKREEIADGLKAPEKYPPTMHFFQGKNFLRQSEVFRIIQKMPKGAVLHGHNTGMVTSKWVIQNLTAMYNVNTCRNANGLFIFSQDKSKCHSEVQNVCTERVNAEDLRLYEKQLEKHINMFSVHPESMITDRKKIVKRFDDIFETVEHFYKYMPAFRAYHKRLLEELCEDNIMYAEVRAALSPAYGDNNKTYNTLDVANELEAIVESFKAKHADFIGLKVIYTVRSKGSVDEMLQRVTTFRQLHNAKPAFIIGLDLVGQEDYSDPLYKYVNELSDLPNTANLFLSAGETNWYGKTDWNLVDAMLLNTKRIGHGMALFKHPQLWSTIKKRNIAIEVSPISSQVMGHIWDLRNHPAALFVAENFPIVISSDYPGLWNAKGLSYDYYYAFMALAPAEADLRFLKQLALNSLKYSMFTAEERRKANRVFQKKWAEFIYNIVNLKF